MSRVAVIGESVRVEGFTLAGALVFSAENEAEVRAAWQSLPSDVAVAVLTPRAANALRETLAGKPRPAAPPPGTGGEDGAGTRETVGDRVAVSGRDLPRRSAPLTVVMPS